MTATRLVPAGDRQHRLSPPGGAKNRWLALAVICVGTMMAFVNVSSTIGALTRIQTDLQSSPTSIVWITSAYSLAVASLILAAGTLSDRLGRRLLFGLGVLFFIIGSATAFRADTTGMLIAAQAIIGVGGAMLLPSGLAIVSHEFSAPRQRTEAVSIWAGSSGLGLAVGPLGSGAILTHYSWHAIFVINIVLGAIALAGAVFLIPDSRHPGRRLDPVGLVLGTLTVATLTFGIIEGKTLGYGSATIVTAYAISAAGLAMLIWYESKHPDPMLDVRLFRSGSFSAVMAVAATSMIGFTGTALMTVLYLQHVQDLSALGAGVRSLVMFVPFIVVSAVAGRLVHRIGFKFMLTVGLLAMGGGILALRWTQAGPDFSHVWPGLLIVGIGGGLLVAPSTAAAVISVPASQAGMASSAVNMFRQLGNVLGASILGTILTSQFADNLTPDLARSGVPGPAIAQIADGAKHGRDASGLPAQVQDIVRHAFNDAFHTGVLVAGLFVLAIAVPTVLFVRHRPEALQPATR
ncbi:MFS transporter [Mangrovactinospora gilvigrisea]|uniref:MFS transporter n=1 Tax=Mangrovactinospora gilvigrisea TaxID=1428644 RepID=A0A1J7BKG8_9ACTN|nr:MFS transporter [Mangrovactinospora gilvigrisea]OIV39175.1 MFS transporter [Mangrovactinospora gilvigrisea]